MATNASQVKRDMKRQTLSLNKTSHAMSESMDGRAAESKSATGMQRKHLKSLQEWNQEQQILWDQAQPAPDKPNDLQCPDCGEELVDPQPRVLIAEDPPAKDVRCLACGYKGRRIAYKERDEEGES